MIKMLKPCHGALPPQIFAPLIGADLIVAIVGSNCRQQRQNQARSGDLPALVIRPLLHGVYRGIKLWVIMRCHPLENIDGFVCDDEFGGEVVETLVLCETPLRVTSLFKVQLVLMVLIAEQAIHIWHKTARRAQAA